MEINNRERSQAARAGLTSQRNATNVEPQPIFDFERWCDEIDEFVAETSKAINEVNQKLGNVRTWKAQSPKIQPTSRTELEFQATPETDRESSSEDRLDTLKRQIQDRLSAASKINDSTS